MKREKGKNFCAFWRLYNEKASIVPGCPGKWIHAIQHKERRRRKF